MKLPLLFSFKSLMARIKLKIINSIPTNSVNVSVLSGAASDEA
jgi:hypothetical protein